MFALDMKPILGMHSVCLLSKAISDLSWLWHELLFRLNFTNLKKIVLNDLVHGLLFSKFDNDSLCATCEQGKQHRQGPPITIDSKIIEPSELLHIDLCCPSIVENLNKKKYILC